MQALLGLEPFGVSGHRVTTLKQASWPWLRATYQFAPKLQSFFHVVGVCSIVSAKPDVSEKNLPHNAFCEQSTLCLFVFIFACIVKQGASFVCFTLCFLLNPTFLALYIRARR
jgi:hypothetical protein